MKFIAKDLEDVAKWLDTRREANLAIANNKRETKTVQSAHRAKAEAYAEIAGLLRDTEIRP